MCHQTNAHDEMKWYTARRFFISPSHLSQMKHGTLTQKMKRETEMRETKPRQSEGRRE